MDDTTYSQCAWEVPSLWPNTQEKITSLRLFAPWKHEWDESQRLPAWDSLKFFVEKNNAKILLGSEITCHKEKDAVVWDWTVELIKKLGTHRIMGLAIGNEMDLLHFHQNDRDADGQKTIVPPGCIKRLWDDGEFTDTFINRIRALDASLDGFRNVPVTTVFSAYIYGGTGGNQFREEDGHVRGETFYKRAIEAFGTRFAFSFNIYPYFGSNNHLDPGKDTCVAALNGKLCFDKGCESADTAAYGKWKMRELIKKKLARSDWKQFKLWMGESGWSTPVSTTTQQEMKKCVAWNSRETFQKIYDNWLKWDLSAYKYELYAEDRKVDHAFYFTMRDAFNFGAQEHFGLISKCGESRCKL